MDESARQFGMAERAKAIKNRDQQQVIVDYWNAILGDAGAAPTEGQPEATGGGMAGRSGSAPSDFVAEAELVGMSAPKAIELAMHRMEKGTGMRQPLKIAEIHAMLVKGGIDYKQDYLYTTLKRSPRFHSPARGRWGLALWYPGAKKGGVPASDPTTAQPPLAVPADIRPAPAPLQEGHDDVNVA